MLGITVRAFCYQAEVIDINGTKYFPAVKEALAKAKESINLVMFVIQKSINCPAGAEKISIEVEEK